MVSAVIITSIFGIERYKLIHSLRFNDKNIEV